VWVWDGDRNLFEHRLVMERKLGRQLIPSELVHHKDENRSNNDPDNLELLTISEHMSIHKSITGWSREYDSCVECGTTEQRHRSFGLCRRCYGRHAARKHRGTPPKNYRI